MDAHTFYLGAGLEVRYDTRVCVAQLRFSPCSVGLAVGTGTDAQTEGRERSKRPELIFGKSTV